ncbi:hypothetical protein LTR64_003596 [Lithohypha guttulata]|uniref:uncharacterized protein n=1 Tax=Lithohypha guttulata TaxID=1690604 RepID=UPI002DDED5EA|nr:hypothetical protein LTR51_000184 [Lithohypha guttulata]
MSDRRYGDFSGQGSSHIHAGDSHITNHGLIVHLNGENVNAETLQLLLNHLNRSVVEPTKRDAKTTIGDESEDGSHTTELPSIRDIRIAAVPALAAKSAECPTIASTGAHSQTPAPPRPPPPPPRALSATDIRSVLNQYPLDNLAVKIPVEASNQKPVPSRPPVSQDAGPRSSVPGPDSSPTKPELTMRVTVRGPPKPDGASGSQTNADNLTVQTTPPYILASITIIVGNIRTTYLSSCGGWNRVFSPAKVDNLSVSPTATQNLQLVLRLKKTWLWTQTAKKDFFSTPEITPKVDVVLNSCTIEIPSTCLQALRQKYDGYYISNEVSDLLSFTRAPVSGLSATANMLLNTSLLDGESFVLMFGKDTYLRPTRGRRKESVQSRTVEFFTLDVLPREHVHSIHVRSGGYNLLKYLNNAGVWQRMSGPDNTGKLRGRVGGTWGHKTAQIVVRLCKGWTWMSPESVSSEVIVRQETDDGLHNSEIIIFRGDVPDKLITKIQPCLSICCVNVPAVLSPKPLAITGEAIGSSAISTQSVTTTPPIAKASTNARPSLTAYEPLKPVAKGPAPPPPPRTLRKRDVAIALASLVFD